MKLMSHYIFEEQAWEFSRWGTRLEGRIFFTEYSFILFILEPYKYITYSKLR